MTYAYFSYSLRRQMNLMLINQKLKEIHFCPMSRTLRLNIQFTRAWKITWRIGSFSSYLRLNRYSKGSNGQESTKSFQHSSRLKKNLKDYFARETPQNREAKLAHEKIDDSDIVIFSNKNYNNSINRLQPPISVRFLYIWIECKKNT